MCTGSRERKTPQMDLPRSSVRWVRSWRSWRLVDFSPAFCVHLKGLHPGSCGVLSRHSQTPELPLSVHSHVGELFPFLLLSLICMLGNLFLICASLSSGVDVHIARLLRTGEGLMITSPGLRIYWISSAFRTFRCSPFWGLMLTSPSVEIDGLMRTSSSVERL